MAIGNTISTRLGTLRKSIREFSRETGISYPTCFDLYHATTRSVSFDILDKLCTYFDCTPADLFPFTPTDTSIKPAVLAPPPRQRSGKPKGGKHGTNPR